MAGVSGPAAAALGEGRELADPGVDDPLLHAPLTPHCQPGVQHPVVQLPISEGWEESQGIPPLRLHSEATQLGVVELRAALRTSGRPAIQVTKLARRQGQLSRCCQVIKMLGAAESM